MKVATWNVNSIKVRADRVVDWLEFHRPDVLCLQELKVDADNFPEPAFTDIGYHCAVHAQKTYNGVAILSRQEPTDVTTGLSDPQARIVSAKVGQTTIISAYMPNGQHVGSDKYAYKLAWMSELHAELGARFDMTSDAVALCGDFNVAPFDDDVSRLDDFKDGVLTSAEVRGALNDIAALGLSDVFRPFHPDGGVYSWWDYRGGGFERNIGLRIDHVYASQPLAKRAIGAMVDREERRAENPSDHAPVMVEFR